MEEKNQDKKSHPLDDCKENSNKRLKSKEDSNDENNVKVTKEDPLQEDCCAICMESDNMEDKHGCPQCAKGAWNICCICHLNTLGRMCPICKHDYQPQILHKVPKIPQFPFNPKSILNPRERFECTMRVRYALEYIRTQNTAIWCPSEKKIFLSLPRDKSAQDPNTSSEIYESQNQPPNVIPENPSTTPANNTDTTKESDGPIDIALESPIVPKKENWIKCISCSKWRSCPADMNMDSISLDWVCTMNNWNNLNNCVEEEEYYSDDEEEEIEEEEEIINGCFLTSLDLEEDQIIDNDKFYFTNKIWDVLEKENENSEEGLVADFINSRKWIVNKMLYPDSILLMETVDEEWNAIINDDLASFDLNCKSNP
jgi:hypothetical protein